MPGRDNGFVARHYVPLADLDPRLADAMLDVLRSEGIAAYAEPSTGRVGGYLEIHPHDVPRDRLWVDRERHERAVVLLNTHTDVPRGAADVPAGAAVPAPSTSPDDDVWAQLVASFDLPSADPVPRWPVAEDVPPTSPSSVGDHDVAGQPTLPFDATDPNPPPADPVRRRIVRPAEPASDRTPPTGLRPDAGQLPDAAALPEVAAPPVYEGYDPLSVLDEHFVPPPPPPVPSLRPLTRWAIVSIVLGVGVLASQAFTDAVPDAMVIGTLGIVGGFVTLFAGMRTERPDDDGPDDGAVV